LDLNYIIKAFILSCPTSGDIVTRARAKVRI